jgi:hypothetical protein
LIQSPKRLPCHETLTKFCHKVDIQPKNGNNKYRNKNVHLFISEPYNLSEETEVGVNPKERASNPTHMIKEANPMKLTYRGIPYDYSAPQVNYGDAYASGKYRGLDIRFRNPEKNPVQQPTLDLVYRGVAYQTGDQAIANDGAASVPAAVGADPIAESIGAVAVTSTPVHTSVQDKARTLMMDHHRFIKRRQQDMLSRLAEEVGLNGGDAATRWNLIQGKIHPTFRSNYDRSKAALS